jgi:hypothetical protein
MTNEAPNEYYRKEFDEANKDYFYPNNATLRQEFVKCGRTECKCFKGEEIHGPYIYAYWKENGKLRKRYVGKSLKEYESNLATRAAIDVVGVSQTMRREITMYRKMEFIKHEVEKDNKIAQEYDKKLEQNKVTFDWAYRVVKDDVNARRLLKVSKIAEEHGVELNYENYVSFISKLMEDNGLRTIDELDSYINTEFR